MANPIDDENGRQKRLQEFLAALYGDPIRGETARIGRYLIIVSLVALAVTQFGGRLNPVSIFPVTFLGDGSELSMMLGVGVVLLTMGFALRAGTDLFHEKERNLTIASFLADERVRSYTESARAIDQAQADAHEECESGPPDDWWEAVQKAREERDAALFKMEEGLGQRVLPRALRRLRLAGEVAVPLAFALFSIVKSWGGIIAFGSALFANAPSP